jgi:hypothetical protein
MAKVRVCFTFEFWLKYYEMFVSVDETLNKAYLPGGKFNHKRHTGDNGYKLEVSELTPVFKAI